MARKKRRSGVGQAVIGLAALIVLGGVMYVSVEEGSLLLLLLLVCAGIALLVEHRKKIGDERPTDVPRSASPPKTSHQTALDQPVPAALQPSREDLVDMRGMHKSGGEPQNDAVIMPSPLASPRPSMTVQPPVEPTAVLPEARSAGFKIPARPAFLADENAPRQAPAEPAAAATSAGWIRAGVPIAIHGVAIDCGLLYVGSTLPTGVWGVDDPTLINPALPVSGTGNYQQRQMGYWPSYSDISPEARRSYLEWLASGRRDPAADIGFVFLYFYGFERRVFVDGGTEAQALTDLRAIIVELEALLGVYGAQSDSFRGYARALLSLLRVRTATDKLYRLPLPAYPKTGDLLLELKVALGQAAEDKAAVPVELMLAWIECSQVITLRVPTRRCAEQFRLLFAHEYRQQFGDGLIIGRNRTRLKMVYRTASAGLRDIANREITFGDLPDLSVLQEPLRRVAPIIDRVTAQLDQYSRHIGKNPDAAGTFDAILLLPHACWPAEIRNALINFLPSASGDYKTVVVRDMAKALHASALSKDKLISLAKVLQQYGVGMEPNVLRGAKAPGADDTLVLYRTVPETEGKTDSPAYVGALTTLQVGVMVANADGLCSEAEFWHLDGRIETWSGLTEAMRHRLHAHLLLLIKNPLSPTALRKKIDVLSAKQKNDLAAFMASLVQADGGVTAKEIRSLEKVYGLLGLTATQVYADVHRAAASAPPATVNAPMQASPPLGAPAAATASEHAGMRLDLEKIRRLREDSAKVSTLLASIFTEEDETPASVSLQPAAGTTAEDGRNDAPEDGEALAAVQPPGTAMLGLDALHSTFARKLLEREQWPRQDLSDIAADLDIFLDGALEQVNEAAFEQLDMPFTEGDDPVVVTAEIMEKLAA